MAAFFLFVPLIIIRFGVLAIIDKSAVRRVAHFAPLIGFERVAYWIYQFADLGMFVFLFFGKINSRWPALFAVGMVIYFSGTLLLLGSIFDFARPLANGFNQRGLYQWSRNPMYTAYFLYFLGCALLTSSLVLLVLVFIFQIAAHWIILSEERWCSEKFGDEYIEYMKRVRRYI